MIAEFDKEFIAACNKMWLAELVSSIIDNGHLISVTSHDSSQILKDAFQAHASSIHKELFGKTRPFDISAEHRKLLRTIKIDGSLDNQQYMKLFREKSAMLLENGIYDWNTFCRLLETYKKDPICKNAIKWIQTAIDKGRLINENGGGCGNFIIFMVDRDSPNQYDGLYCYKALPLFDSDSCQQGEIKKDKQKLVRFLSGKSDDEAIGLAPDCYTLNQPHYNWHMWYKREFENYFPNTAYESLNYNTSALSSDVSVRDYQDIGHSVRHNVNNGDFHKSQLPELLNFVSRTDLERNQQHFQCGDMDLSEIQLVILKLAKVILYERDKHKARQGVPA